MKKLISIAYTVLISSHLFGQENIKDFYSIFSKQFTQMQNNEISIGVDTIIDLSNAYLRIQRKPNDCCHDYVAFTYFKMANGEKIFAHETGNSTTATEEHHTNFYTYTNSKWKLVTQKVFPFSFSFKDFWIADKLPNKKFQKFKIHIALPKNGTNLEIRIVSIDMADYETVYPNENDAEVYDNMFSVRGYDNRFYQLVYAWDAQNGKFAFSKKMKIM